MLNDLAVGDAGEQMVVNALKRAGYEAVKNTDVKTRLHWDLSVALPKKKTLKIEVKNDVYAARSGNIAIEVFNTRSEKESGLSATKADLWAHIVNGEVWITRVDYLRYYTASHAPLRVIANGGDGNARLYLYSADEILPAIFTNLSTLNDKELKSTVKEFINEYQNEDSSNRNG